MALIFNPTNSEFKRIGDIWKRAVPKTANKAGSITFENTRKAVNLFDVNTMAVPVRVESDGRLVRSGVGYPQSLLIPVKPNTTYTISFVRDPGDTNPVGRLNYYSVLPEFDVTVGSVAMTDNTSPVTFTTGNDTKYIAYWLSRQTQQMVNSELSTVMVNEGSTALPYYPYFSPTRVMPNLKAYGGTVQEIQPKLWGRYKPVEYLQSSGTQYIDTGYKLTQNNKIEIEYNIHTPVTGFIGIMGARSGASVNSIVIATNNGADNALTDFNNSTYTPYRATIMRASYSSDTLFKVIASKDGRYIYQDGELVQSNVTVCEDTINTVDTCEIFRVKNINTSSSKLNVYYAKIYDNNILVRNLIPVHDTVDNVYGMFDTVTETFYGNSGTGAFTAGPEIKPVEYLQSSKTQWINTGIYLNGDGHKAEVEYEFDNSVEAGNKTLFGAQSNQNLMTLYTGSGYACGNSSIGTAGRITSNVYTHGHHTISFEMANNKAIYILDNGTPTEVNISASTFVDTQLATRLQLSMFANNNGGNHNQTYDGKIYKFKFWKQGILIRYFIPVKLGTEYCMFDLVEWKVYRNTGTGAFTGGSEIPDRILNPYALKGNLGNIRYGYEDGVAIPSEYERVEYINNGSTGYIITNLYPCNTDKIYVKASTTDGLTANQAIFGNYHDGANKNDFVSYFGNTHFYIWRDGIQQNFVAQPQTNAIYEFTADYLNGSAMVKGDSVNETITFTSTTFACSNKLPLGARYNNGYGGSYAYNFYSVKYYRNNNLIADFVPVKKVSNNEYGLYDTVSKTFFGNAGTGTFTGGSVISRKIITDGSHKVFIQDVPSEYERVEYLENSGTQYINTGITCKDTLSLSCKFQFASSPERNRIFGGRTSTTSYGNIELITYDSKYYIMFGKYPERIIDELPIDTSVHTVDFKNGEQKFDNSIIATESYTFSNTTPIYLFGIYNNGSAVLGTLKVFSFAVCDGNNLVRNFIPVKKISNNEYGMYDTVSKTFFGNAGTGSFTGGPAVEADSFNITEILPSATSYIDQQTGTLYKDWAIKVFDGTESWSRHATYPLFTRTDSSIYVAGDAGACKSNYYEGLAPTVGAGSVTNGKIKFGYWNGTSAVLTIYARDDRYITAEEWKAHLKELYDEGNPVICVYPLATPTTETKSTTPVALTTKGSKTMISEAEIPTTVQATYLGM